MAQDSIIGKLDRLLQSWSKTEIQEKDVVYLFVEIGKFLEQGVPRDQFQYLRFFRNWIVHNKIHDVRAIKELISKIDPSQSSTLRENSTFKKIFINLFEEITKFLGENGINLSPLQEKESLFLDRLIAILAEQPLILEMVKSCIVIDPNDHTFSIQPE